MLVKRDRVTKRVKWVFNAAAPFNASESEVKTGATGAIELLALPAASVVHSVKAYVKTPVTGATSEVVGDADSANGWLLDGFAASAGFFPKHYQAATEFIGAYSFVENADDSQGQASKLYAAARTLLLTLGGTATAGEIDFYIDFTVLE